MKEMKIRIKDEQHYEKVIETLNAIRPGWYIGEDDIHDEIKGVFINKNGFIEIIRPGDSLDDDDVYFDNHGFPEFELKTEVVDETLVTRFVKVKKWKWDIIVGKHLAIVNGYSGEYIAGVLDLQRNNTLSGVRAAMIDGGYDTSTLRFHEDGSVDFNKQHCTCN